MITLSAGKVNGFMFESIVFMFYFVQGVLMRMIVQLSWKRTVLIFSI